MGGRLISWTVAALLSGIAGGAVAAPAPARPPVPPSASSPAPSDPALEAAKAAFEALPEATRKAIQDALVWTGDYNGTTGGVFGRRTYDGILAYQHRAKSKPDGVLDPKGLADLTAAAQRARDAAKFTVATDAKTGVVIGVPEKLLPKRDANPNGGSRWQSPDGKVTLDTRAYAAGEAELPALYDKAIAPQPGRQVTYKLSRPDFFVVTGETPTGKFYVRYAAGPQGIRGFALGYDKAVKDFDRAVIAIANSFVPFPEAQGTPIASTAPTATAPAAPQPAGPRGSGLVVAPRRVLTAAATIEGCAAPRIGTAAARIATLDEARGLALLETESARRTVPLALGRDAASADLVVLSYGPGAPDPALTVTPADGGTPGRLAAPLQPGASGGAAFDRSGALVGLVGALPDKPRLVAGVVPPMSHPLVGGAAVADFLTHNGIALPAAASSEPRSAGELAAAVGAAVVPIACGM